MNTRGLYLAVGGALVLAAAATGLSADVKPASAPGALGSSRPAIVATNTPALPRSVFAVSETSRDPFFPNSTRLGRPKVIATNAPPPPAPTLQLVLRGIAGTADRRMALINNRSIQVGEEVDFKTPNGKTVRVRCLEIKDNTVVVTIGNNAERKELSLRR
jgi:hypothetical protein